MRFVLGWAVAVSAAAAGLAVASCSNDSFTSADAGTDVGTVDVVTDAGSSDGFSGPFCDQPSLAGEGGLWFCSSFDPPQSPNAPFGWGVLIPTCDEAGAPSQLDQAHVTSAPFSFRTQRRPTCGDFLAWGPPPGPRRSKLVLRASMYAGDLPISQGTATNLLYALWEKDAPAAVPQLWWLLGVNHGKFSITVARDGITETVTEITPYENAKWHRITVTTDDATQIVVTIDGVSTAPIVTAARSKQPPYIQLGAWVNAGGGNSDVHFDDVLIYEP